MNNFPTVIARSVSDEAIQSCSMTLDCFAGARNDDNKRLWAPQLVRRTP
jgi:hypothetical protein